jgi:hypothetical protein
MRTRFHKWIRIAAIGCAVVLVVAGTARSLHTSVIADHKHGKAVSEASSFLWDHQPDAAAETAYAPPELELRGTDTRAEIILPCCTKPWLEVAQGRAPPA